MLTDYYSHSQLYMYSACGRKYKFKYHDGLIVPIDSPDLIFGSSIHYTIEQLHKSLYKKPLPLNELFDIFTQCWESKIAANEVPVKFTARKKKEDLYEMGLDIIAQYYKIHINDKPPMMYLNKETGEILPAVEVPFQLIIDELPVIKGFIDLISIDDVPTIIDHKTAAKDYDQFKIDTDLQLIIYACAYRQLLDNEQLYISEKGEVVPYTKKKFKVGFNIFIKENRTATATIKFTEKKITKKDIDRLYNILEMFHKGVKNDIYLPSYGMQCGWCEYQEICQTKE